MCVRAIAAAAAVAAANNSTDATLALRVSPHGQLFHQSVLTSQHAKAHLFSLYNVAIVG